MITIYPTLREANFARQAIWDPKGVIDLTWRANELAGEAGELCNLLKKIVREAKGLPGSRATREEIAEEVADVFICADLVAMTIDLPALTVHPNAGRLADMDADHMGVYLDYVIGHVSGLVHCRKWSASDRAAPLRDFQDRMLDALIEVERAALDICRKFELDPVTVIARKFNITSENVGLPVLLEVE